jgi:hypothetical protein
VSLRTLCCPGLDFASSRALTRHQSDSNDREENNRKAATENNGDEDGDRNDGDEAKDGNNDDEDGDGNNGISDEDEDDEDNNNGEGSSEEEGRERGWNSKGKGKDKEGSQYDATGSVGTKRSMPQSGRKSKIRRL